MEAMDAVCRSRLPFDCRKSLGGYAGDWMPNAMVYTAQGKLTQPR